jgi:SAM-dependent methyltransferase
MSEFISHLTGTFRKHAFENSFASAFVCRAFTIEAFGRLALKFSIFAKRFLLSVGCFSQRAAEYPWVLEQINTVKADSLILDVGCAESLLSHHLTHRCLRVVGLDIRDCPFKNKKMFFVQRNILDTGLSHGIFDAAVMVSTVEHIGLKAYGQLTLEDDGDCKAMSEIYRILRVGGVLIMSTPYLGTAPFKVYSFERNYNREKLTCLIGKFQIIKEDYFAPCEHKQKISWIKLTHKEIDKQTFRNAGIACLVLKKPAPSAT